jgi:hypothetical protein
MRPSLISWDETARRVDADPAATVAMSREQWIARGARFHDVSDGQGERPGLAVGTVATTEGTNAIGVLDCGDPVTYLLVARTPPDRRRAVAAVLAALAEAEVVRPDDQIVDVERGHESQLWASRPASAEVTASRRSAPDGQILLVRR